MQTVVGNLGKKEQTPIDAFSHDIDCGPIGRRPLYKAYGKFNSEARSLISKTVCHQKYRLLEQL